MSKLLLPIVALSFIAVASPAFAQAKQSCEAYCAKRCESAGSKAYCLSRCTPGCYNKREKKK